MEELIRAIVEPIVKDKESLMIKTMPAVEVEQLEIYII